MKISIIIPTYNEAKRITTTLAQFQDLRETDVEVIVTDNGSTDTTLVLAQLLADQILAITPDQHSTIGECRNRGARVATGDILWFIDADVRLSDLAKLTQEITKLFSNDSKLIAATLPLRIYKEEERFLDYIIFKIFNCWTYLFNSIFKAGGAPGDCQIVRRSSFEQVGGYNKTLATSEDFELFHRLIKYGKIIMLWQYSAEMSGRRIHHDGWFKVLGQWAKNWLNHFVLKRNNKQEWEARR